MAKWFLEKISNGQSQTRTAYGGHRNCVKAKRFQRRRFFLEIDQPETSIAYGGYASQRIGTEISILTWTFHRCFLPSFGSFDPEVSEKIFF